jgi:hypothetical protein
LCESGHWRDGTKASQDTVQAVSEDTALDPAIEYLAIDFEAGDITSCGDIADCFHCKNDVNGQ